jgi:hypothetical protein
MGVKLVVFNDEDHGIAITFEYVSPGTHQTLAQGWRGKCTQCGKPMHFWTEEKAFRCGQAHVDSHEL